MSDEPMVDSTEDEASEGERQLIKSQRNKFAWQEDYQASHRPVGTRGV